MFREEGGGRKKKNANKREGVSILEEDIVCRDESLGLFMPKVFSDADQAGEGRRRI